MATQCPKCQSDNTDIAKFCSECASPLQPSKDIGATMTIETPIGKFIRGATFADRYEIIEVLGKGGMGNVYRVEDTNTKEEIALKLIKPEIASDKKTIDRFRNELTTARKIRHKNVCGMYDLGEHKGTHFITMEYVSGEDLKSFIKRSKRLSIPSAISIAQQVCEGLAEAHRLGVVHRDLKPSNVMIDKEGNARIMDFGIARSLRTKSLTGEGIVIGTPEYMSPEQAEAKDIDHRSDIYSVGVILYEMVTGQLPFEGDTPLSIAMKHKSEIPNEPINLNSQIPDMLNDVILKCLEKDKDKRYQTSRELAAELTSEVFSPQKTSLSDRGKYPKSVRITAAALLFILIGLAGYFVIDRFFPATETPPKTADTSGWKNSIAVMPFQDLSPEKDLENLCFSMVLEINNRLTPLGDSLKVSATRAVMFLKDSQKTPQEIGRELGVNYILEGYIRTDKNKILIWAELVNAETASQVWAQDYESDNEHIFDVQNKIAADVQAKIAPDSSPIPETDQPENFEAYEYYIKGMNFINGRYLISHQEKDFADALIMFKKSIDLDPNYALAHTGLAWAYQHHAILTLSAKYAELTRKHIEIAFQLDPNLAGAVAGKAYVHRAEGEYDLAFKLYKKALKIDPNDSKVNHLIGMFFEYFGLYHQAIKYFSRAAELDPFYTWALHASALYLVKIGEYEKSIVYLNKALEIDQKDIICLFYLASIHIRKKEFNKAEEAITKAEEINPDRTSIQVFKARLLAAKGEKEKALAIHKDEYIYSLLGMKDEAIEIIKSNMDKKLTGDPYSYLALINDPLYDRLRDDPRFQEIVKKQKKVYEKRLKKYGDL